MKLSPDETILWQRGFFVVNSTLVWTWVIIIALATSAKLVTRNLKTGLHLSRWQCILEMINRLS